MLPAGTLVRAARFFWVSASSASEATRDALPDRVSGMPTAVVTEMPNRPHNFGSTTIPIIALTSLCAPALKQEALKSAENIATVHNMTCNLDRLIRLRLSINVASQRPLPSPNSAKDAAIATRVRSHDPSKFVGAQ